MRIPKRNCELRCKQTRKDSQLANPPHSNAKREFIELRNRIPCFDSINAPNTRGLALEIAIASSISSNQRPHTKDLEEEKRLTF
jgi:hypothetical protein